MEISYVHQSNLQLEFGDYMDVSEDIAIDNEGCVYITGWTSAPNFPSTESILTKDNTADSIFVAKFSPDGKTLIYSLVLGGSDYQIASSIMVDTNGNAYITGHTTSSDFPTTDNAFSTTNNGGNYGWDSFVTKINPNGDNLIYSTYLGGHGDDYSHDLAIDANGYAYVTGNTESPDFPITDNAFDTANNDDSFITKISQDGSSLIFSTYLGGSEADTGWGISISNDGSIFVGGSTRSSDFPTTNGAFDTTYGSQYCGFVTKINANGTMNYSTYIGEDSTVIRDITIDNNGYVYVTGHTMVDFPITNDSYDTTLGGQYDAFAMKLCQDGSELVYSTFLGGSEGDDAYGINIDDYGNAFVTGWTK